MAIMKSDCEKLLRKYQELSTKTKGKTTALAYDEVAQDLQAVLNKHQSFAWVHALYADKRLFETNTRKRLVYQQAYEDFKQSWVD